MIFPNKQDPPFSRATISPINLLGKLDLWGGNMLKASTALLTFSLLVLSASLLSADGLHDVEIIEPGKYPVQVIQDPCKGPCLRISDCLVDRLKLPHQVQTSPNSVAALTSLSPASCTTHVHRFYYSGNSEFQCPIISGGRTRVVTVHPKTGEPLEFFVMLSAGAPRVVYRSDHFAYQYNDHQTVVSFPSVGFGRSKVAVHQYNGKPLRRRWDEVVESWSEHTDAINNTNTVQAAKSATQDGLQLLEGTGVVVDRALGGTIDASRQITDLLPGKTYLQSLQPERAYDARDAATRQATRPSILDGFIRSNQ